MPRRQMRARLLTPVPITLADTARESQGQYRIDVSLGAATTVVDRVVVSWRDVSTQTSTDVAADRRLTVTEPGS